MFFCSFGYSIHLLASLGPEGRFALNRLSDAIMQVDQVDRKFLQFEGGLSVTGKILKWSFLNIVFLNYIIF